MTKEKKEELTQLLNEAVKEENLEIRYGPEPIPLPVDVYRTYLQERWASYGVDFLSFSFWTSLTPNIADETTKSKLLDCIREELVPFIDEDHISDLFRDSVPAASYVITSDSNDISRLNCVRYSLTPLYSLIERLLKIAIGKGIEEAVSFFDRYSCPEGAHGVFHMVTLIEGIELKTEIQVFEGVRLVPLPSAEIPEQFAQYLPSLLSYALKDQSRTFSGNALLVVDDPGFSILHEPAPEPTFPRGQRIDELPFPVDVHDVKFLGFHKDLFFQALSLVCNFPVKMISGEWISAPDKSLVLDDRTIGLNVSIRRFYDFVEVEEVDIEKAKCLYRILGKNPDLREKLRIPIDRWIKSKKPEGSMPPEEHIDKIIDLGIALEALYLSDIEEPAELSFRLRLHAAWHLKEREKDRRDLMKVLGEIYDWRSKVVHTGELPKKQISKRKKRPFTHKEIVEFIESAQKLCRKSILKILEDGEFPNWNSLILGGDDEQASS